MNTMILILFLSALLFAATLIGGRQVANAQTVTPTGYVPLWQYQRLENNLRHTQARRDFHKRWKQHHKRAHRRLVHRVHVRPRLAVAYHFGTATAEAIRVAWCESRLYPRARNPSGASGLFQLMPIWWAGRIDPFDPFLNAKVAAELYRRSGWSPWVCQPGI